MKKLLPHIFLLTCVAFASDADFLETFEQLTELATKTKLNVDYVPGTVSVVRGDELRALGVTNLNQPNAFDMIVGMDSPVSAMRGVGAAFGSLGNKIKWMINGRPFETEILMGGAWGVRSVALSIPVEIVDRIEMIRGPGSALYGGNAIYGVLNIVTKQNENSGFTSFEQTGSSKFAKSVGASFGVGQNDLVINGSVNIGKSDGYDFYIGSNGNFYNDYSGKQSPGYGPGDLPNGLRTLGAQLDVGYKGLKAWLYRFENHLQRGTPGFWYPTDPLPPSDGKYPTTEIYTQSGLEYSFTHGSLTIKPKIALNSYENRAEGYLKYPAVDFVQPNSVDGARTRRYVEQKYNGEIELEYRLSSHILTGGFFVQNTKVPIDRQTRNYRVGYSAEPTNIPYQDRFYIVPTSSDGSLLDDKNRRMQRAVYVQDYWDVNDRTSITTGVRYDKYSDMESQALSPRIALVYRYDNHNILKAQYSRAFRAPNLLDTDSPGSPIVDILKPETVDTVELAHIYKQAHQSLKTTLFESRIYNTLTFNDITYDSVNRLSKSILRGVEVEYERDFEFATFSANAAYCTTHSDEYVYKSPYYADWTKGFFMYNGGEFMLSPKLLFNAILTLNQNSNFPTTFWYHYVGKKPRLDGYDSVDGVANGSATSNGYTPAMDYLNISQKVKGLAKNLELDLGVRNVFGKTLKTLYMPLSPPNTQDVPYMRQSFWASIGYRF